MSPSKPLTFAELEVNDCFISFPQAGDVSANLFRKVDAGDRRSATELIENSQRVADDVTSHMPQGMRVLKIVTAWR